MSPDDKAKFGVRRVSKGESEMGVLHALVSEARFGDPDELERLYGSDFDSSGHLDASAHSDAELDNVSAFLRQKFAHHGYSHFRSDGDTHIYRHPSGAEIHLFADGTRTFWSHSHNGVQTHQQSRELQSSGINLAKYLDDYHS